MRVTDKCPYVHTDCFAYGVYAKCTACSPTNFESDECPFYKPKHQRWQEHQQNIKILREKGREDLIDKYGNQDGNRSAWRDIDGAI